MENSDALGAMDKFYNDAYSLISSKEAREAFDMSSESDKMKERYGKNQAGQRMLLSRRLVEAGVRFVSLTYGGWDMHQNINDNLKKQAYNIDKPIAALIQDLKDSGLFEDTIILFGSEFGRTPGIKEGATGRDHNNSGFSMWMAGGGIKGGMRHGSTDDFGHKAVDSIDMHDLHATILYLMGVDHTKLTYRYSGRDFRLTDVFGNVQHEIIA
jgi:uncharacterized protein (DUF1501 family)